VFKDRHVVIAMLVAPVLAVIAWYGVDQIVAENPHAARAGAAYSLVAKSNCRYASGRCDLENGDFTLSLIAGDTESASVEVTVIAGFELQGVNLGFSTTDVESPPVSMARADDRGSTWIASLQLPATDALLRVVAQANDAIWYAELPTVFLQTAD
jgi:hypothetical protein